MSGLQPWQFFVLAALACATAAIFLTRAEGIQSVVLLTILIGAAAIVGLAGLRTIRPLLAGEEGREPIGGRLREALEREKQLALRTLKELEFDRAMGKLSDADYGELAGRLRARAGRIMQQLDAGSAYRRRVERDLAKRLAASGAPQAPPDAGGAGTEGSWTLVLKVCRGCRTQNEQDARFCKACGAKL